jgi:Galactose binding lectin domain
VVITAKEYCQFESFNATCSTNQVIVMEEARYGRLQLGRCVTRDYGYIGCSANVLDLLDRSCSGQRQCTFVIPTLRDLVQPCPKDLTSYLDATYKCVNGECACAFQYHIVRRLHSMATGPLPCSVHTAFRRRVGCCLH